MLLPHPVSLSLLLGLYTTFIANQKFSLLRDFLGSSDSKKCVPYMNMQYNLVVFSSQIAIYYSSGNLVSQVVSKLHYSLKAFYPINSHYLFFIFFALSISQRKIKDIHWKIPHIFPSLLTIPLQVFSSRWMKSRGQTSTVSGFLQLFTEH